MPVSCHGPSLRRLCGGLSRHDTLVWVYWDKSEASEKRFMLRLMSYSRVVTIDVSTRAFNTVLMSREKSSKNDLGRSSTVFLEWIVVLCYVRCPHGSRTKADGT